MALKAPAPVARDADYAEWTREQAEILRSRDWDALDLDMLIEELEDMGKSERSGLESALARVIEHLLKLEYGERAEPRRGWEVSVNTHRVRARRCLRSSPSLRRTIDLPGTYADARHLAAFSLRRFGESTAGDMPHECPYALEQLLDLDWWPRNRHGLPAGPGEG